jgi:hypothetical protein
VMTAKESENRQRDRRFMAAPSSADEAAAFGVGWLITTTALISPLRAPLGACFPPGLSDTR